MFKNKYITKTIFLYLFLLILNTHYLYSQTSLPDTKMCVIEQTDKGEWLIGIPDSLLNRDLLFGARVISLTSADKSISAGQMRYNPVVVQFVEDAKGIILKTINVTDIAEDGAPLKEALRRNTRDAVAELLPIVKKQPKISWVNLSKIFDKPFPLLYPIASKNQLPVIEDLSRLYDAKAYYANLEMKAIYHYDTPQEPFSAEIQYSFVVLPKDPMRRRYNDERVGYNSERKRMYADKKSVESVQYISRWKVQPYERDIKSHKEGAIVECEKPIIVRIDTAVPKAWRKYVKQGIEDWNLAFEKIGFKNVIQTRDFTPDMDSEDSRNICFRYLPLDQANANGALWNDPRSGEIVQADILFWQNVTDLLQTWRFVQTAAIDPKARPEILDDETMGGLIRYAVAHEMGHVLGLQHNMRGSYAYPVDSLRSPSFTQKYGTTASIMDYARFNYIAQPGDPEKGVQLSPPILGPFDYLSIKYGYQIFYDTNNEKEEKKYLNQLFEQVENDPMYLFSPLTIGTIPLDPASQNDAIGNDLVYGAQLGIKNIKIIADSLANWTAIPDGNSLRMAKMNDALRKHYFRLLSLSISNIGGIHSYPIVDGNMQKALEYIPKEQQQKTMRFLLEEIFRSNTVLESEQIKHYLGYQSQYIIDEQKNIFDRLFGSTLVVRLLDQEASNPQGYKCQDFLNEASNIIFKPSKKVLNNYEKALQLYYIEKLKQLAQPASTNQSPFDILMSSCALTEINSLEKKLSKSKDPHTKMVLASIASCNKKACQIKQK